jgi:hypothetical protein
MEKFFRYWFIIALFISWPLFTGCYSYLARDAGDSLFRNPKPKDLAKHLANLECNSQPAQKNSYFESLICHNKRLIKEDESFKCMLAKPTDLRLIGFDPKDPQYEKYKEDVLKGELLLRFAWYSDVHMRQRELRLGSKFVSRRLDDLVASAEFNPVQMDFLWAVYLSQIEAVNQLNRQNERVDFMIHTGDSADTGSIEELYQFIYISDELDIPWLNIVGNHDVTIFGNYMARLGYGRDPNVIFYPIGSLGDFIWMHGNERKTSGYGRYLLPVPARAVHLAKVEPENKIKVPATSHHGFDLMWNCDPNCDRDCNHPKCYKQIKQEAFDCERAGDYAFDLCEKPIPIRLFALNSTRRDNLGAEGEISDEQLKWLKAMLLPAGMGINLVFAHHRAEGFSDDAQALLVGPRTLSGSLSPINDLKDRTIVVFTGHVHENHLYKPHRLTGRKHYELNTSSVLEFPQIGRLIELRRKEGGEVWLISRALWNSYMVVQEEKMEYSQAEEIEDKILETCKGIHRNPKMEKPADAVKCCNYGAYADYLEKSDHFSGRPQRLKESWDAANVIIQIRPGKPHKW